MIVRSEYPRPECDRSHRWVCLNGEWDFRTDAENRGQEEHWEQSSTVSWPDTILVPFAWETPTSHIAQQWLPVGWYRRFIQRPPAWAHERTVLHFGAVHYACQVWLNGRLAGEHSGGYLPFSFDITDLLEDGQGEVIVRVEAPLDKRSIPHGKQRSQPPDDYNDCAFTASSGIWQSVWLEGRPATFIQSVQLRPTDDLSHISAQVTLAGPHVTDATLSVQIEGQEAHICTVQDSAEVILTLPVQNPQYWTPQTPHLYNVTVWLTSQDGEDRVGSYTGLRRIEVQGNRLLLNGQRLYVRGALDQGYWPESGYTAPDDAALRRDVELALAAGYNLIRKHLKCEDPRWLYWADRLGLLVWAEPPCAGRYSEEAIARFESQLAPMVARDGNHPSIILWGIYNEEWGLDWRSAVDAEKQDAVIRAYDLLAALDSSRPIIDDSGWCHVKTDILDWHYYDNDIRRWGEMTAALANDPTTWYGHQLAVDNWYETQLSVEGYNHDGLPIINGEYGGGSTTIERGWHLRWQTQELRRHDSFSGYLYTELYDVEHEHCGVYTANRQPRPLGCDPAIINAETVIIFDLVPQSPGCDYIAVDAAVHVDLHISHQGSHVLQGTLAWGWEQGSKPLDSVVIEIRPYEISAAVPIRCSLPDEQASKRLHVWFTGNDGQCSAYNFLDVASGQP